MERVSNLALRACAIDGFGPFEDADYRRSWLFFEEVDYLLPRHLAGPLKIPDLSARRDLSVTRLEMAPEDIERLIEVTRRDGEDPAIRQLLDTRIPRFDQTYAAGLVWSDVQLREQLTRAQAIDPVLFLANKLIWYAANRGLVPIAGASYAAELLSLKLRGLGEARLADGLLSARGGSTIAAFAAGLALDFVPDDQLVATPLSRLVEFKQRNRALLAQHQLHLVDVAEAFAAVPGGADFDRRLAELRRQARRERLDLEARARDAWAGLGLELAKKGITAGTAGLFSGLAVLRGHTLQDLLSAAVPAAVAAGGFILGSVVEATAKARARATPAMAYLFRASMALADADVD